MGSDHAFFHDNCYEDSSPQQPILFLDQILQSLASLYLLSVTYQQWWETIVAIFLF